MNNEPEQVEIPIRQLHTGTVLVENVLSEEGDILVTKGTPLSEAVIKSLLRRHGRGEKLTFMVSAGSSEGKTAQLSKTLVELVDKSICKHVFNVDETRKLVERILQNILVDLVQDKTIYEYVEHYLVLVQENDGHSQFRVHHPMNVFMMYVASEISYETTSDITLLKSLGLCALLHDMALIDLEEIDPDAVERHPIEVVDCFRTRLTDLEKKILLQHHELSDGSGYPNRMQGAEIEHYAALLGVCDAFDQLMNSYGEFRGLRPEIATPEYHTATGDVFHALLHIAHLANRGAYDQLAVSKLISFFNHKRLLINPAMIDDLRSIPSQCPRGGAAQFGLDREDVPVNVRCMEPDKPCTYSNDPRGSWGRVRKYETYFDFRRCNPLTEILNRIAD